MFSDSFKLKLRCKGAPPSESADQDNDSVSNYPLSKRILSALANLMFIPGFTISANYIADDKSSSHASDPMSLLDDSRVLLWERQGDKLSFETINTLDGNRIEVLRALLACLCQDLFVTTDVYRHDRNLWIKFFVEASSYPSLRPRISMETAQVRPLVRPSTIFWSFFSVTMNFNPNPKAKGIVAMLPNTLTDISSREVLVTMCVHLMLVFFEFRKVVTVEGKDEQEAPLKNMYLKNFKEIRRSKDLEILFDSLSRLLSINITISGQVVSTGLRALEIYDELIIIAWKLVDENRSFFKLILNSPKLPELIRPMLFYMYKCKDDPNKAGLLHACALTLLRLSAEREFSVALNAKYEPQMPLDVPKIDNASLGDLLIVVVDKLIIAQLQHLESLFHVLLTILQNVSPYLTKLSMYASIRLLNLFELMSSPKFLIATPGNQAFVVFLLDIFNNLIQYQYNGSSRLVYCMLRRANLFYDLLSLDLATLNNPALSPNKRQSAPQKFVGKGDKTNEFEEEEKVAHKAMVRSEGHATFTQESVILFLTFSLLLTHSSTL